MPRGDVVLYEKKGQLVFITLNRPEKRNAINGAMVRELKEAWCNFTQDAEARVAVLAGAGDRAFCAGIDLEERPDLIPGMPGLEVEVWKPVVAAVTGYCLGAGLVLAMLADIRVAAADAVFGYPEPRVGLTKGIGSALPRYVPMGLALEMLFTGETVSAQRAYEVGLVNRVVPPGEVLIEATRVAEKIAANAPLVVTALKKLAYLAARPSLIEVGALASRILNPVLESQDAAEGVWAVLEKRGPEFQGR